MIGKLFGNVFRGYVEGLGSKTVAFVVMAIVAAILAPVLFQKFGIDPALTREVLYGLGGSVLVVVLNRTLVDVKTGGQTTTQYLMTQRALQGLERILPDGKLPDAIVKEVLLAMARAQVTGGVAGSPPAPSLAAAAPVPSTPPSP